jgi:hypothetical protein
MRRLFFTFLLLGASSCCIQAQTTLPSDSGHFVVNQGNHPVGRSDFSIQSVKQGQIATSAAYSVASHGNVSLQNTKYSFSGSGSLDKNLGIVQENLNGIVNGSAVTFAVQMAGNNFVIAISADGRSYRNSLARTAPTVFFPDFDMASYEILLALSARQPGTAISAFIPKQTGSLSAATLAPQTDVQATFNGKSLAVHHSSLTIGSVTSELYYSGANRILEVDIPSETFAIVHDNFQLQPPPPPPPNAAPNGQPSPNDGGQPQQPQ